MKYSIVIFCCLFSGINNAEVNFEGIIDLRLTSSGKETSWQAQGLGKANIGGKNGHRQIEAYLNEASLLILPRFEHSSAVIHVTTQHTQHSLDIVSAYHRKRTNLTENMILSHRIGIFFPPISFEHKGAAWHNIYGMTPSVINGWIGEELRTLGGEFNVDFNFSGHRLRLTNTLFFANDPAGSLLAWRGFALNSNKATMYETLPLAPLQIFQPNQLFPEQANVVEPFHEIDQKIGYYSGFSWKTQRMEWRVLYYDNKAKQDIINLSIGQYAWHTHFISTGFRLKFTHTFEMLAQYMDGVTAMGRDPKTDESIVKARFSSYFILVNKKIKQHQWALRYDNFHIKDLDNFVDIDNNNEQGHAYSLNYKYPLFDNLFILSEIINVQSVRPARAQLLENTEIKEWMFNLSAQLFF